MQFQFDELRTEIETNPNGFEEDRRKMS